MGANKLVRAMCAIALFNGALFLCVQAEVAASEKDDLAKRYTEELRKAKDAKTKINALQELGTLAQIKKSLAKDALPYIYKAAEDKDAGVRAAAAEALGKADEPYDKAGSILVKMLKDDKETGVKIGAAKGLAAMGSNAKEALPALRTIAKAEAKDKKSKLGAAVKVAVQSINGSKK